MSSLGFPTSPDTQLIVDASVVINLNATERAPEIIQAYPGSVVVTDSAFTELASGVQKGHNDLEQLQALIDAGAVRLVSLGDIGLRIYGSLVEGPALRTLDDGEAATIAYAHESGGIVMIDERKARTICASDFPGIIVASTVDLLTHGVIADALGRQGQIDAVIKALRNARMRVPLHQVDMIVSLIGEEAAATCNSLPKVARVAR